MMLSYKEPSIRASTLTQLVNLLLKVCFTMLQLMLVKKKIP